MWFGDGWFGRVVQVSGLESKGSGREEEERGGGEVCVVFCEKGGGAS